MTQDTDNLVRGILGSQEKCAFLAEAHAASKVIITRAPGRLDVLGGVADYSGSLVAEATICEAAHVALCLRADRTLRLWSCQADVLGQKARVELALDEIDDAGGARTDAEVSAALRREANWPAYLAGSFYVLQAAGIVPRFARGANILLDSSVPLGAGVSSSAAMEVACLQAINVAYGLSLDGLTLARLAQQMENQMAGAPCGIMDQVTSALGPRDGLLPIRCRPHEVLSSQALPHDVRIYGINSAVKHAVGGKAYTRARVAAFMARKLLNASYLAEISRQEFLEAHQKTLPEEICGADFLAGHGETGDAVTVINPEELYPVRAVAEHAIFENDRVERFLQTMASSQRGPAELAKAGDLLYESHQSYSRIGLGCAETDLLVQLAQDTGVAQGIYGAKITGGGSGGTVVFLMQGDKAEQSLGEIAERYHQKTGRTPQLMEAGGSPGAMEFGHREAALPHQSLF